MTSDEPTEIESKFDQVKEAVGAATESVKQTTRSVADAIEAGRQPGAPLDRLARWTKGAPTQAIAVAFLLGFMIGRRRI